MVPPLVVLGVGRCSTGKAIVITSPLWRFSPTHGTLGELGTWQAPGQVLYSSDLQIGESHGGGAGANV